MEGIKEDTRRVREEFDALSQPTQVFIAVLVALGVIVGLLVGGMIGYGIAVEEIDGRNCIEHRDTVYCEEPGPQPDD
jgi:hypothetical protein